MGCLLGDQNLPFSCCILEYSEYPFEKNFTAYIKPLKILFKKETIISKNFNYFEYKNRKF